MREVPSRKVDMEGRRALVEMGSAGLREILGEGGGELVAALLRDALVAEVHWFVAARLLGGDGRPALGALGIDMLSRTPRLQEVRVRRLGDDVHVQGSLGGARGDRR